MDTLSPHKAFRNLDDVRGIPVVLKSTPVPRRDNPLPGTKAMLYPPDDHLVESVTGHPLDDLKPLRTLTVLGVLAMAAALGAIALYWCLALTGSGHMEKQEAWLFFPALAVVHVCGLFSHIFSNGNNRLSNLAILVFWAGLMLSAVIGSILLA